MKFDELNYDQKQQVKQNYMIGLADRGIFMRTIYGNAEEAERDPTYSELADADSLVNDQVIRDEGIDYVPEDFDSMDESESGRILKWALANITMKRFKESNPGFRMDDITFCSVFKALDWAKEEIASYCSSIK